MGRNVVLSAKIFAEGVEIREKAGTENDFVSCDSGAVGQDDDILFLKTLDICSVHCDVSLVEDFPEMGNAGKSQSCIGPKDPSEFRSKCAGV